MTKRNPEEYGRRANVTLQVTLYARGLFEDHNEVDSALVVEEFASVFNRLFPEDYLDDPGFHTWLTTAINDGIERALVVEYDALLEKHGLPPEDANELILRDNITDDARAALSAFIKRWEASGI